MNEPLDGGATVFVSDGVGVRVTPETGMGLFWWDMMRSGEPDFRSMHGACPLKKGEKWSMDGFSEFFFNVEETYD